MAKTYDAVLKHLVEAYPAAWLKSLGFPTTAAVRVIDADVSTVTAAAFFLMGLRHPPGMAAELLRGVREMEESSTYQWVIEKGMVKGILRVLRKTLLDLGTRRFESPTAATLARLNTIDDLERLDRMTNRLLDATDWDDLLGTP